MIAPELLIRDEEVAIPAGEVTLGATLAIPADPRGLVIFAHGSGSSRTSPRNRFVATKLNHEGLATLLLDMLTEREARDRANVFDIDLLARRLLAASHWAAKEQELAGLQLGYFGASTGAGAALAAAGREPAIAHAVVSRGGRPDLAGAALAQVQAPVLLIVGGHDEAVLGLNRQALAQLDGLGQLSIIRGATHLFEEPGALEEVARQAAQFFARHLERKMSRQNRAAQGHLV
jgi:putative phosphoribosyl transferase